MYSSVKQIQQNFDKKNQVCNNIPVLTYPIESRFRTNTLLGEMMDEMKGNVRNFNVYASEQRDQLVCRGHTVDELLTVIVKC